MSKKKKIALSIGLVIIALSVVMGTLAYFSDTARFRNIITAGNIAIELFDQTYDEEGNLVSFPEEGIKVMPKTTVDKLVSIENIGDNECWVRIGLVKSIEAAEGVEQELDFEDYISLDIDTANWADGGDGWYYYNSPLQSGAITSYLFTTVSFDGEMGNDYQNANLSIVVNAQAVQTANNGETYDEAVGWPE